MATVQEILDFDIPSPAVVYRPSRASPTPSDAGFGRPSKDGTATTWNPKKGKFVTRSAGTPRIYGSDQALLSTSKRTNFIQRSDYHPNTMYVTRVNSNFVGRTGTGVMPRDNGFEWSAGGSSSSNIERAGENNFTSGYELVQVIVEDTSNAGGTVVRLRAVGDGQNAWFDFDFSSMSMVNFSNGAEINPGFNVLTHSGPSYGKPVVQLYLTYNAGQVRSSNFETKEFQIYPDIDDGNDNIVVYYTEMTENATVGAPIITDNAVAETVGSDNLVFGKSLTRGYRDVTKVFELKPLFDGNYIDLNARWGASRFVNNSGSDANKVNQNAALNLDSAPLNPFEYNTILFRFKGDVNSIFVRGTKSSRAGNISDKVSLKTVFFPNDAGGYLIKGIKVYDRALPDAICESITSE